MIKNITLTKSGNSMLVFAFIIMSFNFNKEFREQFLSFITIVASCILIIIHNLEFKSKKYSNTMLLNLSTIFSIIFCVISAISAVYLYKTLNIAQFNKPQMHLDSLSISIVLFNMINIALASIGTKILILLE